MTNEKNEAAVLAHNDLTEIKPTDILAEFDAAVKRHDLKEALRLTERTPRDAAKYLHQTFRGMDKTIISKCSNPDRYGCVLSPLGYTMLRKLVPDAPTTEDTPQETASTPTKKHRSGGHKYTARVAGRLPDDKFLRLKRYIRAEGFETVNDWIVAQVDAFIEKMEAKYGTD